MEALKFGQAEQVWYARLNSDLAALALDIQTWIGEHRPLWRGRIFRRAPEVVEKDGWDVARSVMLRAQNSEHLSKWRVAPALAKVVESWNPKDRASDRKKFDVWSAARALIAKPSAARAHDPPASRKLRQRHSDETARVVRAIQEVFVDHPGSGRCLICARRSEGVDWNLPFIPWGFIRSASLAEKEFMMRNHRIPLDPEADITVAQLGKNGNVQRVEVILESYGSCSAIRLQTYENVRMSRGVERSGLDAFGLDLLSASSDSDSSGSDSDTQDIVPETIVRPAYPANIRDQCLFVPVVLNDTINTSCKARAVTGTINVDVIKHWLDECTSRHDICAPDDTRAFPRHLTLIDVRRMRLVDVPADARPHYLVLSYVWGRISQPVLTKVLHKRWHARHALRMIRLPRTIADAIQLTKDLGYKYLWVDALCIVQDDVSLRGEQIAQMHDIYQRADLTIVAADGLDCSWGLPGVRKTEKRAMRHRTYDLPGLSLQKVPQSTRYCIEVSPWRKRGWTFQEELCSRRSIILLPEVMVFSCAAAVWREDVEVTTGHSLPSHEGLKSVRSLLAHHAIGRTSQLSLFCGFVKEYMHRTLSRADDMESAFAGVAAMLEPVLGRAYHGVPEGVFGQVIDGCWFWDTTGRRRKGFPSWSWTGWMYAGEQADVGIRPVEGNTCLSSDLLGFYKLGQEVKALWEPGSSKRTPGKCPAFAHFASDEEAIRTRHRELACQADVPQHLIAFHTSVARLRVRPLSNTAPGASREYQVMSSRQITRIRLPADFSETNKGAGDGLHEFIVVAHDSLKCAYRLMLVSRGRWGLVERVNVTMLSRLVREQDWFDLEPSRGLIVMG